MEFAREFLSEGTTDAKNHRIATLLAYDLQAGSYVENVRANPAYSEAWCKQIAGLIDQVLPSAGSILEVGVGEATTLGGVLTSLSQKNPRAFGFDISWSRISVANSWLSEVDVHAQLFVGDLMNIPLTSNSVDVVYSSHSLEPNGGLERQAIAECLRVARRAVVLVEPIFELASSQAQDRMAHHGYVRGLRDAALALNAQILDYRLLEVCSNPLNPSGVLVLGKHLAFTAASEDAVNKHENQWQCPVTGTPLIPCADKGYFWGSEVGIAYPILDGVPLLRAEHAIVASKLQVS